MGQMEVVSTTRWLPTMRTLPLKYLRRGRYGGPNTRMLLQRAGYWQGAWRPTINVIRQARSFLGSLAWTLMWLLISPICKRWTATWVSRTDMTGIQGPAPVPDPRGSPG